MRAVVAAATVLGGVLFALLVTAGAASAHAELASSNPGEGRSVGSLPAAVELTFTEVVGAPASISVTGPGGEDVAVGTPDVADDVLIQRLDPTGAEAGSYSISYRVVSADGHPVSGTLDFDLAQSGQEPATGPVAPSATADDGVSGGVVAALVTGLVIALAVAVAGLARLVGRVEGD